jgi:hypothetical protein
VRHTGRKEALLESRPFYDTDTFQVCVRACECVRVRARACVRVCVSVCVRVCVHITWKGGIGGIIPATQVVEIWKIQA